MDANAVAPSNSALATRFVADELGELLQRRFAQGGTFLDLLNLLAESSAREIPGHVFRRLLETYNLVEAVREALQDPSVLEALDLVQIQRAYVPTLVEFHFAEPQAVPRATPVGIVRAQLERIVGFYVTANGARLRQGDIRIKWFVVSEELGLQIQRVVHPSGGHDDVLHINAANILATSVSLRRLYLPRRAPTEPEWIEVAPAVAVVPLPDIAEVMAVEHRLPGRVRLLVFRLYRDNALQNRLEQQLRLQDGITRVAASALTGRLLVHFDEESVKLEELQQWVNRVVHGQELASADQLGRAHEPWHMLHPETALQLWQSDGVHGLAFVEAEGRRQLLGPNAVASAPMRSRLQMFLDQFHSLPVALLGASALLSLATGGIADAVVIAGVVLANAVIGYRTERWAEETIADLLRADEIMATVVRQGETLELPARDIVPGDIILLKRGTIVPADGLLLTSDGLSVDESALTGESAPVTKQEQARPNRTDPLSARRNMVYRGTVVTGGAGRALVVGTGLFTEIGKVQRLISETKQPETPLQRQLDLLGTQLVLATLAVCGGVFVVGLLRGRGFLRMLQTSVSLAVAAVPEGLPTVATTTLALGMRRLQQKQVLVRRLNAVETLGAVQDLCLDKTGTITWSRMSVVAAYCGLHPYQRREGHFVREGQPARLPDVPELAETLRIAALCSEVEIAEDTEGAVRLSGTPTETALVQAALDAGIDVVGLRQAHPTRRVRQRSETRLFMDTLHIDGNDRMLLAVKGQPSQVLAMCSHHLLHGVRQPMAEEQRERILLENERMAGRALRVLGVAYGENDALPEEARGLTWLGLLGIADPPRAGMAELIQQFHRAGIHTVMITGDQSATAYAVAREIGLNRNSSLEILDATQLEELDPDILRVLAQRVDVFSRVSPAHKLLVVQALQKTGRVVAMTGDGINDGPALRAADIGIAMGQSGSRVAKDVADIVVADDDLSRLIIAVEQGRTIYDDIRKAVHFILSSNTSEILITALAIAAGLPEPLTPMQLLWINLVTDVFPELALGVEPPEFDVMQRPPRNANAPMFSRADMTDMAMEGALLTTSGLAAYGWGLARYGAGPHASSLAFMSLATAQLLHAISCRSECNCIFSGKPFPRNPYLLMAIAGSMALQGLAVFLPGLRTLLGAGRLGLADLGVALVSGVTPLFVNEMRKLARTPAPLNNNAIANPQD